MFNKNADIKYYARLHGVSLKQLANHFDMTLNDLYLTKLNKQLTHYQHGELIHAIDLIESQIDSNMDVFKQSIRELPKYNKNVKGT